MHIDGRAAVAAPPRMRPPRRVFKAPWSRCHRTHRAGDLSALLHIGALSSAFSCTAATTARGAPSYKNRTSHHHDWLAKDFRPAGAGAELLPLLEEQLTSADAAMRQLGPAHHSNVSFALRSAGADAGFIRSDPSLLHPRSRTADRGVPDVRHTERTTHRAGSTAPVLHGRRTGSSDGSLTNAVCVDYTAEGHIPHAQAPMVAGIPSNEFVLRPPSLSVCELELLHTECVERINMYRSGKLKFSDGTDDTNVLAGLQQVSEWTGNNQCSSHMAMGDLLYNTRHGGGCEGGHYTSFSCPVSGRASQNTCCARGGGAFGDSNPVVTYDEVKKYLFHCLQAMWDEGITPGKKGHWETMRNPVFSAAHCGFAWTNDGTVWMSQDFSERKDLVRRPPCVCAGRAAGVSDGCGGECVGCTEASPGPCADTEKTGLLSTQCSGPVETGRNGQSNRCVCRDLSALCSDPTKRPCRIEGLRCTIAQVCPTTCGHGCPGPQRTCPPQAAARPGQQYAPNGISSVPASEFAGFAPPGAGAHSSAVGPRPTHQGGCRTAGNNIGSFDEKWGLSAAECHQLCAFSAECVAFEHALLAGSNGGVGGAYTRCELHKEVVTHVVPIPGTVCYVKLK